MSKPCLLLCYFGNEHLQQITVDLLDNFNEMNVDVRLRRMGQSEELGKSFLDVFDSQDRLISTVIIIFSPSWQREKGFDGINSDIQTVLLETGFWIAKLGLDRLFWVLPNGSDFNFLSYFGPLSCTYYEAEHPSLATLLTPFCQSVANNLSTSLLSSEIAWEQLDSSSIDSNETTPPSIKSKIQSLIQVGEIEQSINELLAYGETYDRRLFNKASQISGRYYWTQKQRTDGQITEEVWSVRIQHIFGQLISLVELMN